MSEQPTQSEQPKPGDRPVFAVVRLTESQVRTLLYSWPYTTQVARFGVDDVAAYLNPEDLRTLGMWKAHKQALETIEAQREQAICCKPIRDDAGSTCLRAKGHPSYAEDGVGHSIHARWQRI